MRKNKYSLVVLFTFLLALLFVDANAQSKAVKQKLTDHKGVPSFVEFNANEMKMSPENATDVFKQHLPMSSDDKMKRFKSDKDELGFVHDKYQQYYKGVKVEYGTYTVHSKAGAIASINGEFKKINNLDVTPSLSETAAKKKAMAFIGASEFMPETEEAKGELVVVQNYFTKEKSDDLQLSLAYKFDVYAKAPLSRDYVFVDAHSGEIVHKNAIIKHAVATGSAATRYSGTQSIKTDSFNGSYRLRDSSRGGGIETYDCNTGTSYTSAVDFTDTDNVWNTTTNKDNAAYDAHWGAQMTYDYWMQKHNRNSYDGNGAKIKSYVHYDSKYDNAFWNGTVMTYGDGSDTYFDALTSIDVAGHEIGHAVCTYTADLVYSYESGAMNEGFSDIWGACIESFGKYGEAVNSNVWLVGEDIERRAGHAALRSMSNPNSEGQPDTYQGTSWYSGTGDNGGVHYNSGVLNHWFYRLTVGGSGTNDNGSAFSITGIGMADAAKIAYRLESVYLSSNSNYANARTYGIQAATDLFGAGSAQVIATTDAFYAVGIGSAYSTGGSGGGGGTTPPAGNTLENGVTVSNLSASAGQELNYTINVPAGATNLVVTMSGGTGDADLYTKDASAPTTSSYDCRPYATGNSESCTAASPAEGTFYVMVRAYSAFSGLTLKATWTEAGGGTGGGGGSDTDPAPSTYCASKGANATYEWIDLVQLGSINKSSASNSGYANNTTLSTDLVKGTSNTITFSAGFKSSSYTEYWAVYIDYNRDGDFDDAGEKVASATSSSSGNLTGTFTVPSTASSGYTRMRVSMKYNAAQTPCESSFSYGEVEDYNVRLTGSNFAGLNVPAKSFSIEEAGVAAFTVYPNPADNEVSINLGSFGQIANVKVLSIAGQEINSVSFNANNKTLNVSSLQKGMYIIKVNDGRETFTQKFMKN